MNKAKALEIKVNITRLVGAELAKRPRTDLASEICHFARFERDGRAAVHQSLAFFDARNLAEDNDEHELLKAAELLLLEAGFYHETTRAELNEIVVMGRGRAKADFKHDGKLYVSDFAYSEVQ